MNPSNITLESADRMKEGDILEIDKIGQVRVTDTKLPPLRQNGRIIQRSVFIKLPDGSEKLLIIGG